ncbi:hypothetical protein [Hoeflea sp. AS16]|uniref:hypothetical protein n=1 Tax=Hoeflea sp. AS16 TaxID=3135779 RepID=UPI00317F75C0
MLRLLNPAYLQLAVVLLFPSSMIASQLLSNAYSLYQYAHDDARTVNPLQVSASWMPQDVVLSHSYRVWTGEL